MLSRSWCPGAASQPSATNPQIEPHSSSHPGRERRIDLQRSVAGPTSVRAVGSGGNQDKACVTVRCIVVCSRRGSSGSTGACCRRAGLKRSRPARSTGHPSDAESSLRKINWSGTRGTAVRCPYSQKFVVHHTAPVGPRGRVGAAWGRRRLGLLGRRESPAMRATGIPKGA